ncbi:iron-containing redox enzyme family protein [Streptomyces hoynatensis]|uniref:Iron-containing redox enzyme family protein n=1 Tax=Streptomyces hoynatensis TaxID=1141874 RepID=A0A3A9Z6Q4_9ACTN|nr:iron-containing redox enzyme family protein [Streptomyces hoynatensis]RKN43985.1 iron-containing redox enzyme family protein [Streptomyces hoynatensis]
MALVSPRPDRARARPAALPEARGPLSAAVLDALRADPGAQAPPWPGVAAADPWGEDLQLALHTCYELHYRGLPGVADGWEWDAELLRFRQALERAFHDALRQAVPGGHEAEAALDGLLVAPAEDTGLSAHLHAEGDWPRLREYFVHRSIYHLKEADPHAWAIPRLEGRAKAALVAVEYDEFGGGREDRMHARLYAELLAAAGLDDGYLAYLDDVPAEPLALVNLMSLCGLHRGLRGALVGHFAAAEITTAPSARRLAAALERVGAAPACVRFFTEHIEADAVHEQVMRREVVGGLLAGEPELAADVVFGVQATEYLEGRLADRLLGAWRRGESSLRRPLPADLGP